VAGRVVDADTGRAVPNAVIGYGTYNPADRRMGSFGFGDTRTDARGQFILNGVVPGHFAAFVWSESDIYSDPVPFHVTDASITGLEIKVRRGSTISGTAQIEGTSDKRVLARLSQIFLGVSVQTRGLGLPGMRPVTINPDGTFRLTGLAPGRASLFISGNPPPKDIKLVRVERDGVAQPDGIEIAPGAEITGVRLIFEYGSGRVRGTVRAENGELPEGTRLFISLQKPGVDDNARPLAYTQADTRGRFLLEGVAGGEYQLILRAMFPPGSGRRGLATVKQTVTVSNGIETEATLTLDMTEKETEGKQP
ncbi:MAG: hypothetical protein LC731_02785, partial [Acidobacteria bacterium]|nr:hypothetical protein [Acidobacteriota bacterium]